MTTETQTTPKDPTLDALAGLTFDVPGAAAAGAPGAPGAPAEDMQASEAMQKIEQGAVKLIVTMLKVARAIIARKVPEIKDEWTDDLFQAPAEAVLPILKKYASGLMEIIGKNEHLAALAVSLIPLAMGAMNAVERHEKAIKNGNALTSAGGPGEFDLGTT